MVTNMKELLEAGDIRGFETRDMDTVLDIWLRASIRAHDFVDREFWEARLEDVRDLYIPDSETYVYEKSGEVRGFFSLENFTLAALFVAPDSQGRGIGRCLLDRAKSLRIRLTLTVYKENRKSVRFYVRNGFVRTRERVDPYTGHKELVLEYTDNRKTVARS